MPSSRTVRVPARPNEVLIFTAHRGVRHLRLAAIAAAVAVGSGLGCGRIGFDLLDIDGGNTIDGSLPDGSMPDGSSGDGSTPDGGVDGGGPPPLPSGNLRSIGVNAGVLYSTGTASISAGASTVTFAGGANLPTNVGPGDQLDIGGETFFVYQRDSSTQVTTQEQAAGDHVSATYTLRRAFTSLQAWETARQGNLVAEGRTEIGLAYDDGPFTAPGTQALLEIYGSTTDADHYVRLQAAPGQQHTGVAGTGVVLDGGGTLSRAIEADDNYTQIAGLEMRNFTGISGTLTGRGDNLLFEDLLIHDVGNHAVRSSSSEASSFVLRNSILYNGGQEGVRVGYSTANVTIDNCSIYNMTMQGVFVLAGSLTVRNTISGNNGAADFDLTGATVAVESNNLSSDSTASGSGSLTNRAAAAQFVSLTGGSEDLHLKAGADALDTGSTRAEFADDIDGDARPQSAAWDIGADER